ncbi:MAG: hypothetical protein ACLQFR_12300 [Streptosporangiaceae bacterium]
MTVPDPELADGADVLLRPSPDLLELPELAVLDELDLAEFAAEPDDDRWAAAATAWVDPGRLYATAPAARTLASPAAAVTLRTLTRLRSLAAARPPWSAAG